MKQLFTSLLCAGMLFSTLATAQNKNITKEASGVIQRFTNNKKTDIRLSTIDKQNGCDMFETQVTDGRLEIKGSSGVALCRGFYDYIKTNGYGIASWSGNRCDLPGQLPDAPLQKTVSPFSHHYYFNVVTYGYSTPYWDWKRWEQEIDWMALHGIDMPLALVANEAISARVFKKIGLTDDEINAYFVGPAHSPWMRMGNISHIDGPLPAEWHKDQIKLQHQILKRMKGLGMKPVCPGFAGFVPQALKRLYPNLNIVETSWGGAFHNWMLSPEEELFSQIGQLFIEEWEKEFGKNDFYIIDSFNEMEIPFPPKGTPERYKLLASYGENVYGSIKAGNPDAVWVMQGWMFGYQRDIWDYKTLQALVSKVPDDKMLLLDLAVDYSKIFWNNGANWEFYKGFYNKPWIYSVIPNMGGKTGLTGVLSFYANGHLEALGSADKGRLAGFGMAPEGIENNEIIYELLSDAGWSDQKIDTDQWLADYAACRYGRRCGKLGATWDGLRKSVYGSFTDHPRYNWQFRPGKVSQGTINITPDFFAAIENFAACAPELKDSELYGVDLAELAAAYVGGKLEIVAAAINNAYLYGDQEKAAALEKEFITLATGMDKVLESHPTHQLERWLDFARQHGSSEALKNYYEKNARRIVTVWGPPVDDYSARIWSGLIRDYYLPRWQHYFDSKKSGEKFDFAKWELNWVENRNGVSPATPYKDVVTAAVALIGEAKHITPDMAAQNGEMVGNWTPSDVTADWKEISWNIPASKLSGLKGVRFQYIRGVNKLDIKEVTLVMDGMEACNVKQEGTTGLNNQNNFYPLHIPANATGNNQCLLKAIVRSDGKADSYGNVELILTGK